MKKIYMTMVAALLSAGSLFAQTTIASLGFESGDEKGKSSAYALTPGLSTFGDWVNVKDGDFWDEKSTRDKKSGEFALSAENGLDAGNSWDRGFKIANLPIKENTPYRVSFWIKAEPTYNDESAGTVNNTCLTSWLSQGIENYDKSINSPSGQNYGVQMTSGLTGEWQHISFVSYYTNADVLNNIIKDQSWVGNAIYPEGFGGDGTQTYAEYYGGKLPNEFFLIINMYSPTAYVLDDIKVEEGVTFNAATFSGSANAIKLDFGYQTNIAALASASNGSFSLDPSCVKVTINDVPAEVEFVEGKSDGFLYLFMTDETVMEETDDIRVSFTPAEDCPIVYPTDVRPSSDIESEMKVLGFQNEVAYFDDAIDALPDAWSPASMVSSVPENESFEIPGETFNNIAVTYDKALSLDYASATLSKNGVDTDLTSAMSLSEDGKTINIAVSGLADGEYTLTLSGVTNSYGVECEGDQVITFALGPDYDTSTSEVVYASDFDNDMTDGIPPGWVTYNEAGFHIYGFNDNGSQYNYGWGGTPGGGGARLYQGFSGDFNKAMYWGSRGTNEGYAEYGSQVKDWILEDGSLDPEMPEGISLKLEPRKYQVSFVMAAWKGEPVFRFTLEDLDGNIYAQFNDYVAKPNMNGATGKVSGSLNCTTDFTVDRAGYYVLRFAAQDAQWQEFLLANVKVITMPSKAAYWKQQLAAAVEKAEPILDSAYDEMYNGETKTAFAAAIDNAKNGHFTSPSEIMALINELDELGNKMQNRVTNIDNFYTAAFEAEDAYSTLEGKYLEAEIAVNAKATIDSVDGVNPSDLSDEDLAVITPKLVTAAAQLQNVVDVVNILTWGGYKAFQTATTLGADGAAALNLTSDDRDVINQVNLNSKIALYNILAEANGVIADTLMTTALYDGSYIVVDNEYVTTNPEDAAAQGVDFTCLIQNPHFYTFSNNSGANLEDNTIVGWNCEQFRNYNEEGTLVSQGAVHFSGDAATEAKPVSDVMINAYGGGGEYKFYQVIENAPVGIYDVWIASRTASSTYGDNIFEPFNAFDDETGLWDKYIFAQVDDEEPIMTPFAIGGWGVHPTVVKNVVVKQGSKLTIGVVEHYVSGKATKGGEARDFWDTNTFADDARLYFVAPLEGFDYAAAAKELSDGIQTVSGAERTSSIAAGIYSISGARLSNLQKGVNIVRRADGSVSKILVK